VLHVTHITKENKMHLTIRLPNELGERLIKLTALTKRPKSMYIVDALQSYLDDFEEDFVDIVKYENDVMAGNDKTYSMEEILVRHKL